MNIIDVVQGSKAWVFARLGKATASRAADIPARTKSGGYRSSRENYMGELIAERLTGRPLERFNSAAMVWGTEHEDEARREYAFSHDTLVERVGFVLHPRIENFGGSPDGIVADAAGEKGLVEIKCPLTSTHINTLRTEQVPSDYYLQMMANLACTGLPWCDYVSFDPRLPSEMQLFVKRIERHDDTIEMIEAEVALFLDDLEVALADLKRRFNVEELVT